jgi:ATP:corrinoid adenosyltransferase
VGTLEPRKDVPTLVRAFDRLAAAQTGLSLVLAGGRGWGTRAVETAVRAAVHGGRVCLAGYISEEQNGGSGTRQLSPTPPWRRASASPPSRRSPAGRHW